MLVELAAANAAYAVIKECVQNSGEIMQAGKAVIDWFNAKNDLQKKVEEKPPDQRTDLEEFFALEELKKQQQELKELFIYKGRPGLWDDWQAFQVKARQQREAIAAEETRKQIKKEKDRKKLIEQILLGFWLSVLAVVLAAIIAGAVWLYTMKGKF
jgi:uncharacterized protein YhaN